jgi:hypothetical protein
MKIVDSIAPVTSWFALIIYRKNWVSLLAHKQIRSWEQPTRKREKIIEQWSAIHQPRNWLRAVLLSFAIVFLPQFIFTFWFVSPFCSYTTDYGWVDNNSASTLETAWQVTAGLIGITFVIIIFLVEYANQDKYEQRALPIFFTETWMLFTATFGILVILSTGITSLFLSKYEFRTDYLSILFYWQWILFITNTVLILNIFIRTVRILPRSNFLMKLKDYNHHVAKKVVEIDLITKVALNLSDQVLQELGLNFSHYEPEPVPGKVIVSLPNLPRQAQSVIDLNLKLVEIAYRHAKKIFPEIQKSDFKFYCKINHEITYEKSGIAMINPLINRPSVTFYLKRCVRLSNRRLADKSRLAGELILNRDMILRAVNNQESETVEDLLHHYKDLIEAFLQATASFGIHFTQESAPKWMSPFSDWKLISIIFDQYRSVVPIFLQSSDFNMTSLFLKFPIGLMDLACFYRDHLIYQQFAGLYQLIYYRSRELLVTKQKESVINYFEHLLIDHRRFTLVRRLKRNGNDLQELSEIKSYFEDLLVVWNSLLKEALDDRSRNRFSEFSHEVSKLVHEFYSDIQEADVNSLEIQLEHLQDGKPKDYLYAQYQFSKTVLKEKLELIKFKQRMFLGLGGWLVHLLEKDRITKDDYFGFILVINNFFKDFNQLYDAYTNDLGEEREEQIFKWVSWEMNEWTTMYGEVSSGFLTYSSWIDKYYLVRAIEIVPYTNKLVPSITPSFRSRDIYESIEKISKEIINSDLWIEIFHITGIDNLNERVTAIINIFCEAKNKLEFLEEQNVINSPIVPELVDSFKTKVKKSWEKETIIRRLILKLGKYQEKYDALALQNLPSIQLSTLIPKNAFIIQKQVDYSRIGEFFGSEFANIEDHFLGSQLCAEEKITLNHEVFTERINQKIAELGKLNFSLLIIYNGEDIRKELNLSDHFIPSWRMKNNPLGDITIEGLFNNIPVISNAGLLLNSIHLVDLLHIGVLMQYKHQPGDSTLVLIHIDPLTDEKAQKLVDKKPDDWMINPISGEMEDRDKGIRRVLQNVNLQIREYCRFEEINRKAIFSFSLNEGDDDKEKLE